MSSIKIHIALRTLHLSQKHCHSLRVFLKVCFSLMTSMAPEGLNTCIATPDMLGRRHEREMAEGNSSFVKCFAKHNEKSLKTPLWKVSAKAGEM